MTHHSTQQRPPGAVVADFIRDCGSMKSRDVAAAAYAIARSLHPPARYDLGRAAFGFMLFAQAESQIAAAACALRLLHALRWAQVETIAERHGLYIAAPNVDPLPEGLNRLAGRVPWLREEGPIGLSTTPGGVPVALVVEPAAWTNEYDPHPRDDAAAQARRMQKDIEDAVGLACGEFDIWHVEPAADGLAELSLRQPGVTRAFIATARDLPC